MNITDFHAPLIAVFIIFAILLIFLLFPIRRLPAILSN